MKNLQKISAFGKRWGPVVIFSVILILSVILLLLFPRKEHLALSTIFAITFWLSFIACVWQAVVLIRRYLDRNQRKMRTKPGTAPRR